MEEIHIFNCTKDKIKSSIIEHIGHETVPLVLYAPFNPYTSERITDDFLVEQKKINNHLFLNLINNQGIRDLERIVIEGFKQNPEYKNPFVIEYDNGSVEMCELEKVNDIYNSQFRIGNFCIATENQNHFNIPSYIKFNTTDTFFSQFVGLQLEIFKGKTAVVSYDKGLSKYSLTFISEHGDKIVCEVNHNIQDDTTIAYVNPRLTSNSNILLDDYRN